MNAKFDKTVRDKLIDNEGEILGIVSTPDRFENFVFQWKSPQEQHVLKELQGHLEGINFVKFYDHHFWVTSTFFSVADYTEIFTITLEGAVSQVKDIVYDSFEVTPVVFELVNDKLTVMLTNGEIYRLGDYGFRKVKTIDPGILYYVRKKVKYNGSLFLLTHDNRIYEFFQDKLNYREFEVLSDFNFQNYFHDFNVNQSQLSVLDTSNNTVIKIDLKDPRQYSVETVANCSNIHKSNRLVEDENEIWMLSGRNEIFRIDKCDSSFKAFPDFIPLSTEGLRAGQITLNKDFVIIRLENYEKRIQEYILYNRNKEIFERKSTDSINKFFFRMEDRLLCDYKGNTIVSEERVNFYSLLSNHMDSWSKLLFFYHLPLSGVDMRSMPLLKTPHNTYRHILFSEKGKGRYNGILMHNDIEHSLKFYPFLDQISNFIANKGRFSITGDDEELWLYNYGGSFFLYDTETATIKKDFKWTNGVLNPVFINQNKQHVVIGASNKVIIIDRKSQSSRILEGKDKGIKALSMSYTWVNNKNFIATNSNLSVYDNEFNYEGAVLYQSATIINTDFNSYVQSGSKWYILK